MERNKIFNPNLARYEVNPIEKMMEDVLRIKQQRKTKVPLKAKFGMTVKGINAHTLTELAYVDREIVQLPKF